MIEDNLIITNKNTSFSSCDDLDEINKINSCIRNVISTALSYKIRNKEEIQSSIIKYINESGISPINIKDQNGDTLSHIIVRENKFEAVELVIESYINLLGFSDEFFKWFFCENKNYQTVLEVCILFPNKDIIKYIYEIISKTTEKNFRLLENRKGIFHYAALNNQIYSILYFYEKLQRFYKNNLIIDIPTELGITPLHFACFKGNKQIVDILLDLGADINAIDNDGNSCLHFAVNSNNVLLIKKLLIRGADKNIKNKENQTALDLAQSKKLFNIVEVLRNKSFIEKKCNINIELTKLHSSNNNIILFILILFLAMLRFIYLAKLHKVYLNNIKYDVIPFIFGINISKDICKKIYNNLTEYRDCIINSTIIDQYVKTAPFVKGNLTSVNELFNDDIIGYRFIEIFFRISWFFIIIEVAILFIIIKFLWCSDQDVFLKKNKICKENSLVKLYEKNTNFCAICRIGRSDNNIVHCIVCNRCVKNFDHHCTILNICICKNNIKLFYWFLYLSLVYLIFNCLFLLYSK